jgi:hypothetical protein
VRELSSYEVWHSGYHEHRLRDVEDLHSQALYIANNPSRKNYAEYPHVHTAAVYQNRVDPLPKNL